MTTTDALTGLINRREFESRLEAALKATQDGVPHVLCYLDLDRFRVVNDECGHMFGDTMLCETTGLIKEAVRDSDVVARLGGDEFGILLLGCPLEKARQIVDDVVCAVNDHRFFWKEKAFNIGISVGLVEVLTECTSMEDLLHAAESACYLAKDEGGHVHVYTARDEADARHRGEIQWLQLLQSALKEDRFELHARPIMLASGDVHQGGPGLEILWRLKDDKGVSIAPSEIMRVAERYCLVRHVERWVVQTSLNLLARGAIRLVPGHSLFIHLAGETLGDPSFLEFIDSCIDRAGVAPSRIRFVADHNSWGPDFEQAQYVVQELQSRGFRFISAAQLTHDP